VAETAGNGTLWATEWRGPGATWSGFCIAAVSATGRRVRRVGAGFQGAEGAGKLKNWKSEKLNASGSPIARIPDFQDFRFSPALLSPKSCRLSPDGVGWETGNVLNGRFMLITGHLVLSYIRFP
jgi:hypothetical protein